MGKKSRIFIAGLTVSITLSLIPITAQQRGAPPNAERQEQTTSSSTPQPRRPNSVTNTTQKQEQNGQRQESAATPSPTVNEPNSTGNTDGQSAQVARTDEQQASDQAVAVRSLPVVDVKRDWIDYAQIILTIVLIGTTIAAGIVAYFAFTHQRDAIRLTQRADVLLDSVTINPRPDPCFLTGDTKIALCFKNFGPPRASNVRPTITLEIPGVSQKTGQTAPPMPPSVLGAADTFTAMFPPLRLAYDDTTIGTASKGDIPLRFKATVHYTDAFGKPHHTTCSGTYYGADGTFLIEENHDAD